MASEKKLSEMNSEEFESYIKETKDYLDKMEWKNTNPLGIPLEDVPGCKNIADTLKKFNKDQ